MFWFADASFPTPMEEPKKVLRCHYLGTTGMIQSTGISKYQMLAQLYENPQNNLKIFVYDLTMVSEGISEYIIWNFKKVSLIY